jgi:hypothetical protein
METYQIVLITLGVLVALKLLLLLIVGKGSLARVGLATSAFFRTVGDPAFAARLEPLFAPPPPPEPPKPVRPSPEPLRLLSLLQREGRLLDFFLEDVSQATDDMLGAGVRELHRKAAAALREHLTLEPVLPQKEDDTVDVPPGFDPSAIRLTGNVTGQPPYRGTLKHHGWRVKDYRLPKPPEGQDEFVIAPAEVDLP